MENENKPINPIVDRFGNPKDDERCNVNDLIGLTKREYFIAKAMQGLCSNPIMFNTHPDYWADRIERWSIKIADETLKKLKS